MPIWSFLGFQDSNSPVIEQLLFFHDHTIVIILLIVTLTLYIIISSVNGSFFNKYILEGQELESIWTVLPGVLLIFIALPSINTLYLMEDNNYPSTTVKVIGHQWYWSYEYMDLHDTEFDSFMENSQKLRLLNSSENVTIPLKQTTRFIITSSDVIHSWAMPSIGVNVDAAPGRLNQTFITPKQVGLFTGQCSEICGANHSFMPITLEVTFPNIILEHLNNL